MAGPGQLGQVQVVVEHPETRRLVRRDQPADHLPEDLGAARLVRLRHGDLDVKPPGTDQRVVDAVRKVRRRHHDDVRIGLDEVVHLLLEDPGDGIDGLAGGVPAGMGVADDRVELVEQHQRRHPVAAGVPEDLFDVALRAAEPLVQDLRRADLAEVRADLVRQRARQHGLAGAGRPVHEDALRPPRAPPRHRVRVPERQRDLAHLRDHVGEPADLVERHGLRRGRHLRDAVAGDHVPPAPQTVRARELDHGLQHQAGERLQVCGLHVVACHLGAEPHLGAGFVVGHRRLQPDNRVRERAGFAVRRRLAGPIKTEPLVRGGRRRTHPVHDPRGHRVAGLDALGEQQPHRVVAEH